MIRRKPDWLQKPARLSAAGRKLDNSLTRARLVTVCASARCPNRGECYESGVATFMIMGETCSRSCSFCAVPNGILTPLDGDEPQRVACAIDTMGLSHAVVTSVTRDDLPDGGASHFVATIKAIRQSCPTVSIEILTPDFNGNEQALAEVVAARPDVFNHNMETVEPLYPTVRPQASYAASLHLLAATKKQEPTMQTKSGLMLGFGESDEQVLNLLTDLHAAGIDIVTIGQYLRPTLRHHDVVEYSSPHRFERLKEQGEGLGIPEVFSGPYIRSSYKASFRQIPQRML